MSSRQYISTDRKFVRHLSSTSISVMRTGVICEALGSCHPLFLQASKHNRHVFRLQKHCALGLANKRRGERGMRSQQLHSLLDAKPSRRPPSFVFTVVEQNWSTSLQHGHYLATPQSVRVFISFHFDFILYSFFGIRPPCGVGPP